MKLLDMLQGIKNIIFDLGGVIYAIDYLATIRAFKDLGIKNFEQIYAKAGQSDLFDDLETGKISKVEFFEGINKFLPNPLSPTQITDAWNAMLIGLPKEKLELLSCLSQKYRLFLLSNANELHIQCVNASLQKQHGIKNINGFFEKAYYSQEIGMRKPHKATFDWVLQDAGIQAEETLFIEDTAQHIAGAKLTGLKTHHLESNSALNALFPDTAL